MRFILETERLILRDLKLSSGVESDVRDWQKELYDRGWRGRFSAGDNTVALQDVRVTATSVHFELPGEGTFEGAVAGDSMAGSISGANTGSFALERHDANEPRWEIYPRGP